MIRAGKVCGTSVRGRDEPRPLLGFIRPGDGLVVMRGDRLARSMGDLQDVIRELGAKGATLRATEQPIDTSTAAGKAFLDMARRFRGVRDEPASRAADEGMAKAHGVYEGGKTSIDVDEVRRLLAEGVRPSTVARRLCIGRASVWRVGRPAAPDSASTATPVTRSTVGTAPHGSAPTASRDESRPEPCNRHEERAPE